MNKAPKRDTEGEIYGFVLITLSSYAASWILALVHSLVVTALEEFEIAEDIALRYAVLAAVACLIWLPLAFGVIRRSVQALIDGGGLPRNMLSGPAAAVITLGGLAVMAYLEVKKGVNWSGGKSDRMSVYNFVFAISPALWTWLAVRYCRAKPAALGTRKLAPKTEKPIPRAGNSMNALREVAGPPVAPGAALSAIEQALAALDRVDMRLTDAWGADEWIAIDHRRMAAVGEAVVREANALTPPLMDALPHDGLLYNLMLSCSAYSDLGRMVAADEFGEGRLLRDKTAAKYRDAGITASSDFQLVLAVAREARNRVARQEGREERRRPRITG